MSFAKTVARKILQEVTTAPKLLRAIQIYRRYQNLSMSSLEVYINNLMLCANRAPHKGCIVEAGVWRGGMSAGIADMLPGRAHYLFDSFQGLPPAKEIDGEAALRWQKCNSEDNCRAERSFAEEAMKMSHAKEFHLIEGWFTDTVSCFTPAEPIAILRLDGDWYDSTMQCLNGLYRYVMPGGLLIFDDYYTWDGQARALHDYLSIHKSTDRIDQWRSVCYVIKRSPLEVPL